MVEDLLVGLLQLQQMHKVVDLQLLVQEDLQ